METKRVARSIQKISRGYQYPGDLIICQMIDRTQMSPDFVSMDSYMELSNLAAVASDRLLDIALLNTTVFF